MSDQLADWAKGRTTEELAEVVSRPQLPGSTDAALAVAAHAELERRENEAESQAKADLRERFGGRVVGIDFGQDLSGPGHHINAAGEFQSDKHPELPADRVCINIAKERTWPGLLLIADAYQEKDAEFAGDLRRRILALAEERGIAVREICVPIVVVPQ